MFHPQYSTKQLPKNAIASETKDFDDIESKSMKSKSTKYDVRQLKTLNLQGIPIANRHLNEIAQTNTIIVDENAEKQKEQKEIINWESTPLNDQSKLINQYLMLSKIRLTSIFTCAILIFFFF